MVVASGVATAGGMLVAGASPAGADFISPNGWDYTTGTQVGSGMSYLTTDSVEVFAPVTDTSSSELLEFGTYNNQGQVIGDYSYEGSQLWVNTAPALFADGTGGSASAPGSKVTDCYGELIGYSAQQFKGCQLVTKDASNNVLDSIPMTVVPTAQTTITYQPGWSSGGTATLQSSTHGVPAFEAQDSFLALECLPMTSGFDFSQCTVLGIESGGPGNHTWTGSPVSSVNGTACHVLLNGGALCSVETLELHVDSTGWYGWPIEAESAALSFK